jgi:prefoldin alpha subunit
MSPLIPAHRQQLYVSGTVADTEKVLVDIGTGYFAECSVDAAHDMLERKTKLLRDQIEKVTQVTAVKKGNMDVVMRTMQQKVAQSQAQPAPAQ